MKPSEVFNSLRGFAEIMSHFHTATAMVSAMLGKEPPPDASATVKGAFGFFGQGDERAFEILLTQAEEASPGARAIVAGFRKWARLKGTSIEVRAANAWYDNAFRNHFLGMGASEGKKIGEETETITTIDPATKAKTVVVKKLDVKSSSTNPCLNELLVLVEMIRAAPSRAAGYKLVTEQTGIPQPPKNAEKTVRDLKEKVSKGFEYGMDTGRKVNTWFGEQVAEHEAKRSWLRRWIDTHLG